MEKFRNLDVNRFGLDEMVALSAEAGMAINQYEELELETPDFLLKARKSLLAAINEKNRGRIEARAKEVEARLDAMTPASTKRAQLKGELAKLRAKLAG